MVSIPNEQAGESVSTFFCIKIVSCGVWSVFFFVKFVHFSPMIFDPCWSTEAGKPSWVPVCSLKTGSLERGRAHNYCGKSVHAEFNCYYAHSLVSPPAHTSTRATKSASREASSRSLLQDTMLQQRTLGGESTGSKRKAGIRQITREEISRTQIQKKSSFVFHRMRYLNEDCTAFDSAVH